MKRVNDRLKHEFYGCYLGKVEDRNDELKIGRVRVRVFELHSESLSVEKLPWFLPAYPITASQHKKIGDSGVPEIGSTVVVQFVDGNILQGIYTHTVPGADDLPNPDEYLDGTGYRKIRTPSGHTIEIKDKEVVVTQDDEKTVIKLVNGTITISGANIVNVVAADEVNVEGKTVTIKNNGPGKGDVICNSAKFLAYFATHLHPTGVGPSGPPISSHGFKTNKDWHTDSVKFD